MSPLGEESTLRKVSGGSEGYGSEEGLQVVESLNISLTLKAQGRPTKLFLGLNPIVGFIRVS